jgi:4-diphosphocytidyl-2-C-methyl-D-erythritol kinase
MTQRHTNTGAVGVMAPAKINLSLHVTGKRDDGYHLLDSLVVFAGTGDHVTALPADDITLNITGPFGAALAGERDNLVTRAAKFLRAAHGITEGAAITLEKNLPVASGIGGGSADAAATLVACGNLWGVDPKLLNPTEVAAKLGADVPVCLRGVPAFMSGIGEVIDCAPQLPDAWLVLVNPGEPLATKDVFKALAGRFSKPMHRAGLDNLPHAKALTDILHTFHNDLMAPARELLPAVGEVLDTLAATPGCLLARLSGSGPTCFGVFATEEAAQSAAKSIAAAHPRWWTAPAPVLK